MINSDLFRLDCNKTIARKGGKSIIIKTQNQERCRITVLLTITADGGKLPPLLIFKAKRNGIIKNELKKDYFALKNYAFLLAMKMLGRQWIL